MEEARWEPFGKEPNLADVLIVVPVHNEAMGLSGFLEALGKMDWCGGRVVFVDDGSTDASREMLREWIEVRPNAQLVSLDKNVGKAAALNVVIEQISPSGNQLGFGIWKSRNTDSLRFLAVFDADDLPQPNALKKLLGAFVDEKIAAATGRRAVVNPLASRVATYCTFENLVHQHITVSAKHVLDLNPPILGSNCVYRLSALEAVGGFQSGALLEDSDLTVRYARAGWRTVYVPSAVSTHVVPETLTGYVRQHLRWGRGFHQVMAGEGEKKGEAARWEVCPSGDVGFPRCLTPTGVGVETWMFSMGYLDRVALLTCLLLSPRSLLLAPYFLLPFLQTLAALKRENAPRNMWVRLWVLPFFFCIDITLAILSLAQSVLRRPTRWENARTV